MAICWRHASYKLRREFKNDLKSDRNFMVPVFRGKQERSQGAKSAHKYAASGAFIQLIFEKKYRFKVNAVIYATLPLTSL